MKTFKTYLKEELNTKFISEGLIASWDTSKLVDNVKRILKTKILNIDYPILPNELTSTKYGKIFTVNIELISPLSSEETKKLDCILSLYGYTNSLAYISEKQLQLEPKYPVKMNSIIENIGDMKLYHITRDKFIDKISKIGLTPKSSQTIFDHPDNRIYLIWIPKKTQIQTSVILSSMRNVLARDKEIDPKHMNVLVTDYVPDDTYYLDDTTILLERGIFGVFTTKNIPPKNLRLL